MDRPSLLRRFLPWLAPPLVVAACVYFGQLGADPAPDFSWQPPEPPPEPAEAVPSLLEVEIRVLRADGTAAEGAAVALLEPALAAARAGADGVARLLVTEAGPYRAWLWAPGHKLLEPPPFPEPPADGFRLEALATTEIPRVEGLPATDLRFLLQRRDDGAPLSQALVLATPAGGEETAPWLDLSGPDGAAGLRQVFLEPYEVRIYAPGLPPLDAWLLHRATVDAAAAPPLMTWDLACARLRLRDLPPLEILYAERTDAAAPLPLRLVPDGGVVEFSELPPGRYRFRVAEREWEAELAPGWQELAAPGG